jgi:hypothetical protein
MYFYWTKVLEEVHFPGSVNPVYEGAGGKLPIEDSRAAHCSQKPIV